MSRLFVLLLVLAIGIGALGYYRGWFTVSTTDSPGGPGVNIGVDREKVRQDKERVKEKVEGVAGGKGHNGKERADQAHTPPPN
jgi:hypothetical protein